jgi:hypothetical protein
MAIKFLNNSSVTGQLTVTNGIEMTSGNFNAGDNERIRLGNSADLQIYHDGSNSFIQDAGTGSLKTVTSGFQLLNSTQTQFMMLADGGATSWIKLYYSGSERLATTSTGIYVTGEGYSTAGWGVGTGETPVGKIFNNSGVFNVRAETAREIAFGNVTNGEAVRIDTVGNVGIGTTSPTSKLTISSGVGGDGSWNDSGILVENTSTTTGEPTLAFRNAGTAGTGSSYWFTGLNQSNLYKIAFGTSFTDGNTKLELSTTGGLRLNSYTQGFLQTDANGNVSTSGGGVLPGGPYLPLTAGSGSPLTGDLYITKNSPLLTITDTLASDLKLEIKQSGSTANFMSRGGTSSKGQFNFRITDGSTITSALFINQQANVGIGTTSPGTDLEIGDGTGSPGLTLNKATTGTASLFFDNAGNNKNWIKADATESLIFGTNNSTNVTIKEGGNVGIGTTSPQSKLDVKLVNNSTANIGGTISVGAFAGLSFGYSEVGNSNYRHSAIVFERDDAAFGDARGKVHILNSPSGSTSADLGDARLTILPTGKVGIGTTNPYSALQVGDPEQTTAAELTIASRYGSSAPILNFRSGHASNNNVWNMARIVATDDGNYNGRLEFRTSNSGQADPTVKMVIKATGNVGIGTTAPSQKLHVAGNMRLQNQLYDSTNSIGSNGQVLTKTSAGTIWADNRGLTPTTPGGIVATIVGETIEIAFNQSTTSNIDYYQVWSSDDGGDYGIIGQIAPSDFSSTMTVVDTTFVTGGTMSYRVYAVKSGVYSPAGTVSKAYTVSALSVTNMTVVNLNTAYYIQYEKPLSRFIDHVEIYMDSQTTSAALSRSNASIVYSGQNASYMRNVGTSNNFHQFWVEIVTS